MQSATTSLSSSLRLLDFSENESLVYLALVELTSLEEPLISAGPLISKTNLHRNIVYTSLSKLQSLKLVNTRTIKGRTYFSLNDPGILQELFAEKAEVAKHFAQSVKRRLPNSLREVSVHEGSEEYWTLVSSLLKAMPIASTKLVMGTGGNCFMEEAMLPIWTKYHELIRKKKIQIRMIGYESQRKSLEAALQGHEMYKLCFLPDEVENPAGMHVYTALGSTLNIIYPDEVSPVTAILMKNENLCQGYELLFSNLWKIAKQ